MDKPDRRLLEMCSNHVNNMNHYSLRNVLNTQLDNNVGVTDRLTFIKQILTQMM